MLCWLCKAGFRPAKRWASLYERASDHSAVTETPGALILDHTHEWASKSLHSHQVAFSQYLAFRLQAASAVASTKSLTHHHSRTSRRSSEDIASSTHLLHRNRLNNLEVCGGPNLRRQSKQQVLLLEPPKYFVNFEHQSFHFSQIITLTLPVASQIVWSSALALQ